VVQLITTWNTPVDGGGGNNGRFYLSPPIGAGWTNLECNFAYTFQLSGAFRISGESLNWFNRFPQPPSPFLAVDPQPSYVTTATDTMRIDINNGAAGFSASVQLLGDPATPQTECAFGTRLKDPSNPLINLSAQSIQDFLFARFIGTTLDARRVCGSLPPQVPPVTNGTVFESIDTLTKYLYVVAWPSLCECIPGTPTPTPPPPPGLQVPPGFPASPVLTCANTDICAALQQLTQLVVGIAQSLNSDLQLDTLMQRYQLPFAFVEGATHSGLTGTGSFRVDRLKGLRVSITSNPGTGEFPGNPPYVKDQGWISVSDISTVFLQERRVSQSTFDWFPREMQMAELVGYEFFPGITASITELEAET
jgi:hypothetical protein